MSELIPEKYFSFLPFKSEPLSMWAETNDLCNFIVLLHDKAGLIIGVLPEIWGEISLDDSRIKVEAFEVDVYFASR